MSQKGTDFWCGKQYAVHETGFLADTLPAVTWTASCVWIELSILGSAWVKWAGDQVSHPTLEWQFSTQHYYRTIAVTISPLTVVENQALTMCPLNRSCGEASWVHLGCIYWGTFLQEWVKWKWRHAWGNGFCKSPSCDCSRKWAL